MKTFTEIDVDFVRRKFQSIDAKAGDESSRYLRITCYNDGVLAPLDVNENDVYMRYKKPDDTGVFKKGIVRADGKVDIELAYQMLTVYGLCEADLLVVNKGGVIDDGNQLIIKKASILSSMTFNINVQQEVLSEDDMLSEDDYSDLVDIIEMASFKIEAISDAVEESETNADLSKKWAVGPSGSGSNTPSDTNNSYYYSRQASSSASSASSSASSASSSASSALSSKNAAATSETNARVSETNAKTSEINAKASENAAASSEANSATSEANAKASELAAATSETNSKTSENNAKASETAAATSEANSKVSEDNAKASENAAATSQRQAKTFRDEAAESESNVEAAEERITGTHLVAARTYANNAANSALEASASESNAADSEIAATQSKDLAKKWAVGDTGSGDETPSDTNSAYYYSTVAEDYYEKTKYYEDHAEAWANGTIDGEPIPVDDPAYHKNSKYWAQLAQKEIEPKIHGADYDYVLMASDWSEGEYSIESDFPYEHYSLSIGLSEDATLAQIRAFGNAMLTSKGNLNVLKVNGLVPTINIPVVLYAIEKATA